jgi:septal ring factor EnvC (AmiA/AmiB activator)
VKLRSIFVIAALVLSLPAVADSVAGRQSELDALKRRLNVLQQETRRTEATQKAAADELRASERAISDAVRALRELDGARKEASSDLEALNRQADSVASRVRGQQARLADALRAAHRRGEADALRLLLDGGDPNQTARELRYLAHISRAQQAQIEALRSELATLAALREKIEQKNTRLVALRTAREAEQERLLAERAARAAVLDTLSSQIRQQHREITGLQRDERNLTQLVERLNRLMAQQAAREAARARAARQAQAKAPGRAAPDAARQPLAVNTETPVPFRSGQPFSRLKGSLRLPVPGELMNHFGAPREDGGVSWKGVFIRAAQGTAVKAIAAGRVVFSEWLRGFGNLVIVDHGEGYMSLYSNNESLYKQVGEQVQPGDAIAAVGNSGGQPDTGLYFEMRHQSRPLNPLVWVK